MCVFFLYLCVSRIMLSIHGNIIATLISRGERYRTHAPRDPRWNSIKLQITIAGDARNIPDLLFSRCTRRRRETREGRKKNGECIRQREAAGSPGAQYTEDEDLWVARYTQTAKALLARVSPRTSGLTMCETIETRHSATVFYCPTEKN